jgi:hypothetical protein
MHAAFRIRKLSSIALLAACATAGSVARSQQPPTARSKSLAHKDPLVATLVGVVLPGGGQLYTERYGKAAVVLGGTAAAAAIAIEAGRNSNWSIQSVGIATAVVIWGYGWVTAGSDARRRNDQMLNTTVAPFIDRRNGRVVAGLSLSTAR